MGLSITAACHCGFHSGPMLTGGGMLNYETTNYHPCLCRRCRSIVPCNIKETPVQCFSCGQEATPYGNANPGSNFTDADLWNGQHECPQCGEKKLKFQMGLICWIDSLSDLESGHRQRLTNARSSTEVRHSDSGAGD